MIRHKVDQEKTAKWTKDWRARLLTLKSSERQTLCSEKKTVCSKTGSLKTFTSDTTRPAMSQCLRWLRIQTYYEKEMMFLRAQKSEKPVSTSIPFTGKYLKNRRPLERAEMHHWWISFRLNSQLRSIQSPSATPSRTTRSNSRLFNLTWVFWSRVASSIESFTGSLGTIRTWSLLKALFAISKLQ